MRRWMLALVVAGCAEGGDNTKATDEVECWGWISEAGMVFSQCGDLRSCCSHTKSEVTDCWYENRAGDIVYDCATEVCGGDSAGLEAACGALVAQ